MFSQNLQLYLETHSCLKGIILSLIFIITAAGIYAQVDSLIFSNGNYIDVGLDLTKANNIKLGFTLNHDNRPVEDASEIDYVFHTGFGWEW